MQKLSKFSVRKSSKKQSDGHQFGLVLNRHPVSFHPSSPLKPLRLTLLPKQHASPAKPSSFATSPAPPHPSPLPRFSFLLRPAGAGSGTPEQAEVLTTSIKRWERGKPRPAGSPSLAMSATGCSAASLRARYANPISRSAERHFPRVSPYMYLRKGTSCLLV